MASEHVNAEWLLSWETQDTVILHGSTLLGHCTSILTVEVEAQGLILCGGLIAKRGMGFRLTFAPG